MSRKKNISEQAPETRVISEVEQVLRKLKKQLDKDKENRFFKVEEE